jgi:uncharacterized protein YdaU (DUF1376 family)
MPKAPPSFDLYVNDFIGGTSYMTPTAVGCYLRLLMFQWGNGKLPRDPSKLSRICICSLEEFRSVWEEVSEKFISSDESGDFMVNSRLDQARKRAIHRWNVNRANGLKGGRPKKPKGSKSVNPNKTHVEGGRRKDKRGVRGESEAKNLPFDSPEFAEAWADFLAHREAIGTPLTPGRATTLVVNKCIEAGEKESIAAIERTVISGKWLSIFPESNPKTDEKGDYLDGLDETYQQLKSQHHRENGNV